MDVVINPLGIWNLIATDWSIFLSYEVLFPFVEYSG